MHCSTVRRLPSLAGWSFAPHRGGGRGVSVVRMPAGAFDLYKHVGYSRPKDDDFNVDKVVELAAAKAGVPTPSDVPHYEGWRKLCAAALRKRTSNYGAWLLHRRIVHALSERLGVEDAYRLNGDDIAAYGTMRNPIFLLGLPRVHNHMAAHILGRSGFVLSPTTKDTMFAATMSVEQRSKLYAKEMRYFMFMNPQMRAVRTNIGPNKVDDDINLLLQTPHSLAWGLLHGLDDHLLDSMQEDQTSVYQHHRRVLQLFQYYRHCGQFYDAVAIETNPIDNVLQEQREGRKDALAEQPFCIHSPLALVHVGALHSVYSDMRIVWNHRALPPALSSLCSALALHNSLYTGKGPSETQLGVIGEKVCGIFGSGTEHAVNYLANFPSQRMLHMASVDFTRHPARLSQRILEFFGCDVDKWRKMQAIDAQTEYVDVSQRPAHLHKLANFGLHEGIVASAFDAYCFQFEEYAFLEMPGAKIADSAAPAGATAKGDLLNAVPHSADRSIAPGGNDSAPVLAQSSGQTIR